ncbi:hypothetical protein M8C21_006846 [Ambrosia artemisiifolia]|uniref:Uncharacterized protein n=1 Tax=Ambrosia artemisiifolia TaxID=4212 RepID=A0AAD5G6N6_AMBAR|nr:hypothetical protein M8C21_006846 [Ambrosia artemisiifolia]
MSRPLLLVTLLLLMVLTSQLDWNQKIVNDVEARSSVLSRKQQYVLDRKESVKEKKIEYVLENPISVNALIRQEMHFRWSGPVQGSVALLMSQIILSQEKQIQKLKTLVQSLQEQLQQCKSKDEFVDDTKGSLTEVLNDLKQQQIMV